MDGLCSHLSLPPVPASHRNVLSHSQSWSNATNPVGCDTGMASPASQVFLGGTCFIKKQLQEVNVFHFIILNKKHTLC